MKRLGYKSGETPRWRVLFRWPFGRLMARMRHRRRMAKLSKDDPFLYK